MPTKPSEMAIVDLRSEPAGENYHRVSGPGQTGLVFSAGPLKTCGRRGIQKGDTTFGSSA